VNGHRQIIDMRKRKLRPPAAFVIDSEVPPIGAEWELPDGLPTVYVGGDSPELSDLRFLTGMRVHLQADDSARAVLWVDRLLQDGSTHVIQTTDGEVYQWRP